MTNGYLFQEERFEVIALLDEFYDKRKGRSTKHLKALKQELLFQLVIFDWGLLIREYGQGEILRRIKDATPSGQNPPAREMRAFAIASKYFVHDTPRTEVTGIPDSARQLTMSCLI